MTRKRREMAALSDEDMRFLNDIDLEVLVIRDASRVIREALVPDKLDIKVEIGCGGIAKLQIFIVTPQFEGLPLLQRHKLVQAAVRTIPAYERRVHAITITKALTPAQYEETQKAA
ncbi:unnamed protein product [Allacma fusca]|uniref:Uncharacterized protein n=1 Tax=Allacma fusca TaxID=39272 RepID=A0A8J2JLN2_9HEXA|nr:unnamed protein product [Allacma fusca]